MGRESFVPHPAVNSSPGDGQQAEEAFLPMVQSLWLTRDPGLTYNSLGSGEPGKTRLLC